MRIRRKVVDTIRSCDTSMYKRKEKEGMVAVQISKKKKLSGRSYREWVKSLGGAKGSDPAVQKERLLSQIDSGDNGTTNTNSSSQSPSKPVRLDFQLRRIRDSYDAKRRNSPYLANETEKSSISEKFEDPFGDESKSTTTDFVEYWVPVRLSNIQTEQYCGSLFSKSSVLCYPDSWGPMKFLDKMLVSTKLCCDHPYLVDWSLHTSLINGIPQPEQLDAQIKLSSKLLLLLKALVEIKKRGLRVLILYQSLGGSGPITTGDILDDIIHEKFGEDSFVRIDGNISRSKRRRDLRTFNEKKGGKFVCLMETRASIPSTKLKSIDAVIFFNSDWDPTNDLKALQKMSLDSQFEQVKIFRLYSAHTVEEKVLMLTKYGTTLEGSVRKIKRSTCRELLAWGAYFLFQKLEDFHAISTADTDSIDSNGDTFMEEVFQELSILLPNNDKSDVHTKSSLILEAQQIEGVYSTNMQLVGEAEYPLMENYSVIEELLIKEPPYVFWINILGGRNPSWKYFSCQSPRAMNSAQSLDDLPEECGRPSKKCRTEARTTACQTPKTRRRRRRRTSGEAAAASGMQTSILDKPPSLELQSQLPLDDHDQLLPSSTEAENEHHPESFVEYRTIESPLRNTQSEGRNPSWKYFSCQSPRIRNSAQSVDDLPEECGRPSKKCRTEAGTTACETPKTRRRRRRRTSGEAAAASGMQTSILDKPPSLELQSQLPLDDHDQLLPSSTEAENEHHPESFVEYRTIESPLRNTQSEGRNPSWKYFSCQSPRIRNSAQSVDDLPEECGRPSKKCRTEAGTTACETPKIRRRRRRRTSGEAAAASRMQTSILDKPPSLELQSQLPLDDHDRPLPSPTEAQNEHHLESFSEYCTRESPLRNTQRAANTAEDARARETSQVNHFEVLGTVCKALQTEMDRLGNRKTESSKQHEDMKLQTKMAYEKEVDEIHKKYEAMLQNAHTAFLKEQQVLDTRYNKLRVNKALAEALMQRDSNAASLSQVAVKFSVEQALRLISQPAEASAAEVRGERVPVASPEFHSSARGEGGWLRAPAPHLMHSPPCAFPQMPLPSERPRITFSAVTLEHVTSCPLPLLPP